MRTCVIIPAYNEAATIAKIIQDIKKLNLDIVVIDDGSTDNTAAIAQTHNAVVIKNTANLGKGSALATGFSHIINNGYDAVITMDADGQHLSCDIPEFLRAAEQNRAGIIIGNRMGKRMNMPWIRVLTNKFMSRIISRIAKQHIPDTQCGFRLIKKQVLENICLKTRRFEIESELLIEASRAGFSIACVPIQTVYLNEKSHINPFTDTLRFIRFIRKQK